MSSCRCACVEPTTAGRDFGPETWKLPRCVSLPSCPCLAGFTENNNSVQMPPSYRHSRSKTHTRSNANRYRARRREEHQNFSGHVSIKAEPGTETCSVSFSRHQLPWDVPFSFPLPTRSVFEAQWLRFCCFASFFGDGKRADWSRGVRRELQLHRERLMVCFPMVRKEEGCRSG